MSDPVSILGDALAGRYTITREIGRGGMASVYLAHDVRHDRPVAVKVLHPQLAMAIGSDRFLREIQVVARLSHPHIVPLYDSGEAAGLLYYVMPFVKGESVRERLLRAGPLAAAEALRITREVADALDYAHAEGIVHRDIKPDNVMLGERHAMITDFGIARALSESGGAALTQTGILVGTPAYMSPEQVTGEYAIDGRSDIYSLGCVLYEMLTGAPPFSAPTAQAVMAKRFAASVPPLEAVQARAPEPVTAIVATALRLAPAERFQTAHDMLQALDAAHDAARGDAGYVTPSRTLGPSPSRHRGLVWLAGVGILLVAAAVLTVNYRRRTASAPGTPNASAASVGVLPFANRSDSREMEYFSDGVTDELISALSRVQGLQVAGRASSFSLKGKGLDAQQSAQRLQVRYLLDGSVRSSGSRVRVSWQLMDGTSGRGLGSGDFDGQLQDVISLQDSLVREIVKELRPALGASATAAAPKHEPASFDAYDMYLKGHFNWNQRTPETMRQGIAYLKQAIEKDSNYAIAWAELSSAYTLEPAFGDMRPTEVIPLARAAARRAVELDSTLSEAYTALGMSSTFNDWDWPKALQYLDRAVALDPRNSFPRLFRAWPLVIVGRKAEAAEEILRARELDPLSSIINTRLGTVLMYQGKFDEAIAELRKALAVDPSNLLARFELGKGLSLVGRFDEAFKEFPDAIDAETGYAMGWVGLAYGLAGRRDDARAILRRLEQRATERYITPEGPLVAAIGAGDKARALDWLERGYREHSFYLVFLKLDQIYDGLRDEPRFKEVVRKIGL